MNKQQSVSEAAMLDTSGEALPLRPQKKSIGEKIDNPFIIAAGLVLLAAGFTTAIAVPITHAQSVVDEQFQLADMTTALNVSSYEYIQEHPEAKQALTLASEEAHEAGVPTNEYEIWIAGATHYVGFKADPDDNHFAIECSVISEATCSIPEIKE